MEAIYLDAKLEEKLSEKKGTKYFVITINLTPTLVKQVFLEPAEVEAIRLYNELNKQLIILFHFYFTFFLFGNYS